MNGSSPESNDSEWLHEMIFARIYQVEIPSVACLGLFGNGMGMILLRTNGQLKRLPSQPFLLCLAGASSLFLASLLLVWADNVFPGKVNFYSAHAAGCKLVTFVGGASDFACIWFIVAVSLDRLVILYWPLRWRLFYLSKKRLQTQVSIGIFFVSFVLHIWILVIADVSEIEGCGIGNNTEAVWETLSMAETVYSIVAPSLIVFLANTLVVIKLARQRGTTPQSLSVSFSPTITSMGKRLSLHKLQASPVLDLTRTSTLPPHSCAPHRLSHSTTAGTYTNIDATETCETGTVTVGKSGRRGRRRKRKKGALRPQDIRITKTMVILTSSFVLLNLPHYLYRVLVPYELDALWTMVVLHLAYFLYHSHHALVFFTYIFNSRRLRRQLKPMALKLLECYCLKPVPDFGHPQSQRES